MGLGLGLGFGLGGRCLLGQAGPTPSEPDKGETEKQMGEKAGEKYRGQRKHRNERWQHPYSISHGAVEALEGDGPSASGGCVFPSGAAGGVGNSSIW